MVGPLDQIQAIRRPSLGEIVVERISKAILDGTLKPGQKLPGERDLARAFEVTRTSVRDGLKQLEGMGLIAIKAGEGAFVQDPMLDSRLGALEPILQAAVEGRADILRSLQEFRLLVQSEVARQAAARRTGEQASQIASLAARLGSAPDARERARVDWQLSRAYASASGNPLFAMVLNTVRHLHEQWAPVYFSMPEVARKTARYHAILAEAIRRRDGAKAARVMRLLLEFSNPVVLENMRRTMEGP